MNKELEEYAERTARAFDNDNYKALMQLVIDGAKYVQERMFSEEDLKEMLHHALCTPKRDGYRINMNDSIIEKTIEKFKK